MEIQLLRVLLRDADLSRLFLELMPDPDAIEKLEGRFTPAGVRIRGEYPTGFGFKVPFDTVWELEPAGSTLRIRLASLQVAGLPAKLLEGALLRMLRDAIEESKGVTLEDKTLLVDVPTLARHHGVEVVVRFTALRLVEGELILEAGG